MGERDEELVAVATYLDSLIEMIPKEVYIPQDDNAHKNKFGHKKRALPKDERKADDDTQESTGETPKDSNTTDKQIDFTRTADLEELRRRMHEKIQKSKARRNPTSHADSSNQTRKRKLEGDEESTKPQKPKAPTKPKEKVNLEFSRVAVTEEIGERKVGKPGSRAVKKQKLLEKAEEKKKIQQELHKSKQGTETLHNMAWDKALTKAEGVKVFDDPSKIRKSIKRDEAKKKKSSKKWKEIKEQVNKHIQERQTKRAENIKNKKERGSKKSQKPKGKRPGFEGKKKEFLNKPQNNEK
eukprot:c7107_g1_i1.p2 GENE.c7107_g1_i1~~c7107_g1_i1.p2  ORF type:complete len:315 (-),score=86.08 c7107_g1_i1:1267-2157(-)